MLVAVEKSHVLQFCLVGLDIPITAGLVGELLVRRA
jgi:hypothetical protein